MSKYVKSYKLKLDEDKSFGELICDYPRYVDIEQADETSVSIKLMDEAGKLHHVNFIARTELRQQDGLTSNVFFLDEPILDVHHEILPEEEKVSVTLNMRLKGIWCCIWGVRCISKFYFSHCVLGVQCVSAFHFHMPDIFCGHPKDILPPVLVSPRCAQSC